MSEKALIAPKSTEEVRKAVGAIHTSGNLSLLERKVVNVLLLNAYDDLLDQNKTHELPVAYLCDMLGWKESNNIHLLKELLEKLATTKIEFNVLADAGGKKSGPKWGVMAFISFGGIADGICSYRYDKALAQRLYDPEIYATINIDVQKEFKGSYALNLYENCVRYKRVGSTGWWDLPSFRKLVGADNEFYTEFKYLNRDVILPAIKEINTVSDIIIGAIPEGKDKGPRDAKPEYRKNGRSITHIKFHVRENPQQQLLKEESCDEHEPIRKSEVFGKLRTHGVGERLAIAWILEQGEERVQDVVAYVEGRERKKLVKGSTAGYIRRVIEDGGALPVDREQQKKDQALVDAAAAENARAAEKALAALDQAWKTHASLAVAALPPADLESYFTQYQQEVPQAATLARSGVKSAPFLAWLRLLLVPREGTPGQ